MSAARLLQLAPEDNVYVATGRLLAGAVLTAPQGEIRLRHDIELGHKVASRPVRIGAPVIRAGMPIGLASAPISAGDWVHTHNLVSSYIRTFDHRGGADGTS